MVGGATTWVPGIHWAGQEDVPPELEQRLRAARGQPPGTNLPRPEALQQQVQEFPERTQDPRSLAAVSVSVKVQLIQDTARVSVTQLFVNNSGSRIPRASYTFPLPYGCTVIGFTCRVGRDRVLHGKVKPKEEARASFEEATARDETAGLLDQHTTEIFRTTLGNIPRNSRVKAEISFLTIIDYKFEDGHSLATFTLPTYIAPRYGNSPTTLQQEEPSFGNMRTLDVQIGVLAAEEITAISSPSHTVSVEMGVSDRTWQTWSDFIESGGRENPRCAIVKLVDAVSSLDRDFIVTIQTLPEQGTEMPSACVEQHPSFDDHRAVMLTIPECFMQQSLTEVPSAEIVFVSDRSGSMSDKIDAVKSAMNFFLRGIPQGKHFNIWSFGSIYESLWGSSILYSESALQEALTYVSAHFQADMGGTELLLVLKAVARRASNFHSTDIIVLTDGQVWDVHGTLEFVRHTRLMTEGRVRVFSLGIGDAVSHALVEGMAKAGGGYAEVIPSVSQTGLESRVVAILQAALSGHIGPIKLEIDESAQQTDQEQVITDPGTTQALQLALRSPVDISTLSPFLRNRVFILYETLSPSKPLRSLRLIARRLAGGEVCVRVPIKLLQRREDMIHKFAARALLGDLEQGQSHIHVGPHALPRSTTEQAEAVRIEGERIGCKWTLLSRWTSFYAERERPEAGEVNGGSLVDDGEPPSVESVDQEDPGLLRPRGPQTHFEGNLVIDAALLGESGDESESSDEDSDEEPADDVESQRSDRESNNEADESDSHDGEGGGPFSGDRDNNHDARSDGSDRDNENGDDSDDDQPPGDGPANTTRDGSHMAADRNTAHPIEISSATRHGAVPLAYPNLIPQGLSQGGWTQYSKGEKHGPAAEVTKFSAVGPDPYRKRALSNRMSTASLNLSYHRSPEPTHHSLLLSPPDKPPPDKPPPTTASQIVAPAFNPPASTSLLNTPQTGLATREDEAKQHVVRNLLGLQAFDGSFPTNNELLTQLFGPMFLQMVGVLKIDVVSCIMPEHTNKVESISLTFATVGLLATQFTSCEPLWRLMVVKAKNYTRSYVRVAGYLTVEREAEALFATMELPRYQLQDFDLSSITAQSLMNTKPVAPKEDQSNDPPKAVETSPKGAPAVPDITVHSHSPDYLDGGDIPASEEPLVRRRISLEFAPWEDENGPDV